MNLLHVRTAHCVSDFQLWVEFDDGASGIVDLKGKLTGSVFEPLKDPAYFARVSVDPELATVVWPNGADLAVEFLRDNLKQ